MVGITEIGVSVLREVMPMVEVYPVEQAALAYERMMTAKVRFRGGPEMGGGLT